MAMPNLPDEIIFDILTRLPVKSLMRFKCVCKPWGSVFSDPQFRKTHLQLIKEGKASAKPYKLLMPSKPEASILDSDLKCLLRKLDYPFRIQHFLGFENSYFGCVGSCNGLVCLELDLKTYVIWNPSTAEYKLVSPPISNPRGRFVYPRYTGFGYDSTMNDYKVVRAVCSSHPDSSIRDFQVQVLTLQSNKWKLVNPHEVGLGLHFPSRYGIFLNQSLHWLASTETGKGVLSFDMKEERFTGYELLPEIFQDYILYIRLHAFENSLFVVSYLAMGSSLWIWEKKGSGDRQMWTRLFIVSADSLPTPNIRGHQLYITKYSAVIWQWDGTKAVTYDLRDKTTQDCQLCCPEWVRGVVYLETLISPN